MHLVAGRRDGPDARARPGRRRPWGRSGTRRSAPTPSRPPAATTSSAPPGCTSSAGWNTSRTPGASARRRPARAPARRRAPPWCARRGRTRARSPRTVDAHGTPLVSCTGSASRSARRAIRLRPVAAGPGPMSQTRPLPGSRCGLEPGGAQPLGDELGGPHLGAAQLRVRVDVAADLDELVAQRRDQGGEPRRHRLRRVGPEAGQRGDEGWRSRHAFDPSRERRGQVGACPRQSRSSRPARPPAVDRRP